MSEQHRTAYPPLSRDALRQVIEGRGHADRIPVLLQFWSNPGVFGDRSGEAAAIMAPYPQDAEVLGIRIPEVFDAPAEDPSYRWAWYDQPADFASGGLDERVVIEDWDDFAQFAADFPDPHFPGAFPAMAGGENASVQSPESAGKDAGGTARAVQSGGERYRLGHWWYCLFERHWQLRGMENALTDFYLYPEEVHRLYRLMTDFYKVLIRRGQAEWGLDGIFTSDDLGTQKGLFFSTDIFDEFFAPYYKELFDTAHACGMHFWLHTCGGIKELIPRFIELGLDVLHPIQKYTMDEREIAAEYGDKICIWSGFDVQRTIPYGTADDVRREVRYLYDTYYRPDGRLMFTAGNGLTGDCPLESLEALFDEAYRYGTEKCRG